MEFYKFFKTYEFERDGDTVHMAVWIEPDGDKAIMHLAAYPEEALLLDITLTGDADPMHENFEKMDQTTAESMFDLSIAPIIKEIAETGVTP